MATGWARLPRAKSPVDLGKRMYTMPYYKPCPLCGAALDPGEICDCRDEKKTAPDATNIESGVVECEVTSPTSASILTNT